MVYIYTCAYNAEKTIHSTINSILNQTYSDFQYYILDNGSLDDTKKIIREYAKHDERIIPLINRPNRRGRLFKIVNDIISLDDNNLTEPYFAILDADDEYAPDFLEKMLTFIQENTLEVAACGTDWINVKTGEIIKKKVLDKNLILEGQDFAEQFPIYRNYMATVWGVVYSIDLLRKCSFEWATNAIFGGTTFVMEAFRNAKRAGILAEVLHKYYISSTSSSHEFNPDFFKACKYQNKISREYLLDYGKISKENEDYLYVQLLILIKYIMPRILNADVSFHEKLEILHEIFTYEMTQYILIHWKEVGIYSSKSDFLTEIETWLCAQSGSEISKHIVKEIITAMNV